MAAAKRHIEADPSLSLAWQEASRRLAGKAGRLLDLRKQHLESFLAQGLPTPRVEAWKYTNVAKFTNHKMALADKPPLGVDDVAPWLAGGPSARRLIFANGHLMPEMSHIGGLPHGVTVKGLGAMLADEPERVGEALSGLRDGRGFTDLNTAFAENGAWIELDEGVVLDKPLQLVFLSAPHGQAAMTHPRVVVRLGKGAKLHLIESHVGLRDGSVLTNLVTQVEVDEDADLVHDRLQLAREGATTLTKADVEIGSRAHYKQTVLTLGGTLQRNETEMRLKGPGIEAHLNGAFMPTGIEHVDTLIRIHHMAPECESNQFYKGVLDGKSRGVFAGKIVVHPDAQKTNAFQQNNNLLRSDAAEVDTKPELEIYADDVKCSHGATVGDLDERALFYLRSRGLPRDLAESVLTYAFAGEVIERFEDEALRKAAMRAAFRRMPGGEALMEML